MKPNIRKNHQRFGKKVSRAQQSSGWKLKKEAKSDYPQDYLDLIVTESKDKAEGLKSICDQLNEKPTLFNIGDTIFDIQAAKKNNIVSVGIAAGYHPKEKLSQEKPDFLLESLLELRDYFLAW